MEIDDNLEDVDLFREEFYEEGGSSIPDDVDERVGEIDDLFSDADIDPTIYPVDETLHDIKVEGELRDERVVLGVPDLVSLVELDEDDFEYLAGDYVAPHGIDDVILRMGVDEPPTSEDVKREYDNVDLRIPFYFGENL